MTKELKKTPPEPKMRQGKKKLNRLSEGQLVFLRAHLIKNGQSESKRCQQINDLLN